MMWNRVVFWGVVAVAITGASASAAGSKASLKCRMTIGKKTAAGTPPGLVKKGLAALDKCHAKRDKTAGQADCNAVSLAAFESGFSTAVNRACTPTDPVRINYLAGDPAVSVLGAVQDALAASGAAVQGSPNLAKDKAKVKCHAAIGKARSLVVQSVVSAGVKCQSARDKSAGGDLGRIAADCGVSAGNTGAKASAKITKACNGVNGADVGSCASLPDCVIASAQETGNAIAKAIYGEPIVCGDGVKTGDEECDDGNTVDGDACTSKCKISVCGDKIVSAGEECDDGNLSNTDACTRVCADGNTNCVCRTASCGDGFVQEGVEECDDGNDVAGDGCTACHIDAGQCTPGAQVIATVAISYDDVSRHMQGFEVNLSYPAAVSIPGSGNVESVIARLTDIPGVSFALTGEDRDTGPQSLLHIVYGGADTIPVGDVVDVLFDCESTASLLGSSFSCAVTATSDPDGQPIPGTNTCTVHRVRNQ